MIFWIALLAFSLLGIRSVVALANLWAPSRLQHESCQSQARVSILIPARDEEKNIKKLLEELIIQSHPQIEIWVYDDGSRDQTFQHASDMAGQDARIQVIRGNPLPDGWLGKNHACHQLASRARGEYMLFLDADVAVEPDLVASLLSHAQRHGLDLLSVFPVQETPTMGERLTVPLMNHILLSFLPLILSRVSPRPSLAAANGQCMFFLSDTYLAHDWHASLRMEPVEDIRIMQEMKRVRQRAEVLLSQGQIRCRMYSGYREAIHGFARNFHYFFGRSEGGMLAFGLMTSLAPFLCWLAFGLSGLWIYILGSLGMKTITSYLSKQHILIQWLIAPLQHLAMLHIMIHGIWARRRGKLAWKGRRI